MKMPATGPYVDRIIRVFRDMPEDDGTALVLHDYARATLALAASEAAVAEKTLNAAVADADPGKLIVFREGDHPSTMLAAAEGRQEVLTEALRGALTTMQRYQRAGHGDDVFMDDLCQSIRVAETALAAATKPVPPAAPKTDVRALIADIEEGRADGFLNSGSEQDAALACPHCGGSGHKNDVSPAAPTGGPHLCPVCDEPFKAGDQCATDIDLGMCHAECLEGCPTVNLDTGDPIDGPIPTYPYEADDAPLIGSWDAFTEAIGKARTLLGVERTAAEAKLDSGEVTVADGIRKAIRFVERRRDAYVNEHGFYDPTTGVTEFPGNGDETVAEWEEIIEGLQALATTPVGGR